ncbi:MAG: hypothetical protein H5T69_04870 [Chloroflexi bacterium]|nr:hypothetical protein [Chloroflexota bacterium]
MASLPAARHRDVRIHSTTAICRQLRPSAIGDSNKAQSLKNQARVSQLGQLFVGDMQNKSAIFFLIGRRNAPGEEPGHLVGGNAHANEVVRCRRRSTYRTLAAQALASTAQKREDEQYGDDGGWY